MSDTVILPEAKPLPDAPKDGITGLFYVGEKSLLASTSWDGSVRVHDTATETLLLCHSMDSGPLLSLAVNCPPASNSGTINNDTMLYTGGMDGSIRMLNLEIEKPVVIGKHEAPANEDNEAAKACSCLSSISEHVVASAGWHRMVHLWDIRQRQLPLAAASAAAAMTVNLPGKAFAMDVDSGKTLLAVATSGRRQCFIDIRYQPTIDANLVLDRESLLKYQTRCLRFFPDGNAIVVGSIEGRAACEFLDELARPAAGKKYAFKCHRIGDRVFPVNAIDFNPKFGTFATGGCDGTVVLWDGYNKKKLSSLQKFPTSIAALAFNHDGSELAIASSYTFEEGERDHPKDEIYIRALLESECRPKSKS